MNTAEISLIFLSLRFCTAHKGYADKKLKFSHLTFLSFAFQNKILLLSVCDKKIFYPEESVAKYVILGLFRWQ